MIALVKSLFYLHRGVEKRYLPKEYSANNGYEPQIVISVFM